MPGVTETTISSFLETNYGPSKLESLAFKDNFLLGYLPKDESVGGDNWVIRYDYKNVQGIGATFAKAKERANATNFNGAKFTLDYEPIYSLATVDNLAIERAQGGGHSIVDTLQRSVNGAMETLGDILETALWGTGYGELGQVGSISTNTITLLDIDDAAEKFEEGYEVGFASSLAASVLRGTGGGATQYLTVDKVNRETGVITFTANVSTVTGGGGVVAANDYIFLSSFREDSATPNPVTIYGVNTWNPATTPGTFAGQDRSKDPVRLGGWRYNASAGQSVKSTLISAVSLGGKFKAKPDVCVMSWSRMEDLLKEVEAKVYVDMESTNAKVSFRALEVQTPNGPIKVVASAKCPNKHIRFLTKDSWKLGSVNGAVIRPTSKDGKILEDDGSDGKQIRYRYFGNLACFKAQANGVAVLP